MSLDDFWHRNYTHEWVKLKTAQVNPAGRSPITVTCNVITRRPEAGGKLNHLKKKLLSERSLMRTMKKPMSKLHDVTLIKTQLNLLYAYAMAYAIHIFPFRWILVRRLGPHSLCGHCTFPFYRFPIPCRAMRSHETMARLPTDGAGS